MEKEVAWKRSLKRERKKRFQWKTNVSTLMRKFSFTVPGHFRQNFILKEIGKTSHNNHHENNWEWNNVWNTQEKGKKQRKYLLTWLFKNILTGSKLDGEFSAWACCNNSIKLFAWHAKLRCFMIASRYKLYRFAGNSVVDGESKEKQYSSC